MTAPYRGDDLDTRALGQSPDATGHAIVPVTRTVGNHDGLGTGFDDDEDGAEEAEILDMRARLKEIVGIALDMQEELEQMQQRQKYCNYSDPEIAKLAREAGFALAEAVKRAHSLAAQCFFKAKNSHYAHPEPNVALEKIDLHCLLVNEAIVYVIDHLERCKDHGLSQTRIICGWGRNRQNGARIRGALIELFQQKGIKYIEPPNLGCLIVYLNDPNAEEGTVVDDF